MYIADCRKISQGSAAPFFLLRDSTVAPRIKIDEELDGRPEEQEQKKYLLCRACSMKITSMESGVSVNGGHEHTFFNPQGIVFEICCFAEAPGALVYGRPTTEFSWFKGYSWSFSICRGCNAHLGWFFEREGNNFFGLIINRLIFQ